MGDLTRNFSEIEFACNKGKCGCKGKSVSLQLVYALQLVRQHFGKTITINSGIRCTVHNNLVGGSANSKHISGQAADFTVDGISPDEVADFLDSTFTGNNGLGRYNSFTHFDVRSDKRARWDMRA